MAEPRRQSHAGPRRDARVNLRVAADDKLRLEAAAAGAGMTLPAYLVYAGLRGGGFDTPSDRDAAVFEVIKLERAVARVGNNVNQIAHRLNALGEVDPGMAEAAAEVRAVMAAVRELGMRVARLGES